MLRLQAGFGSEPVSIAAIVFAPATSAIENAAPEIAALPVGDDAGAARERVVRRAGLLLFIALVFLGGVFAGAWLTGLPSGLEQAQQPVAALPPAADKRAPSAAEAPQTSAAPAQASAILAHAADPEPHQAAAPAEHPLPPAAPELTAAEIHELTARGDALLQRGEAAAARPYFQRAALAGDGSAARRLAQTYDPAFIARSRLRGVQGDLGLAVFWYRRGQELGDPDAAFWLRQIDIAARSHWDATAAPEQDHRRTRR